MAKNCDISYNITENAANFSIFRRTQIVCLQCVSNGSIFSETSWSVPDASGNNFVTVTNLLTFNSSYVQVVNGVLMVKDPASQLINGYYLLNAYCSMTVSYLSSSLYLFGKFCTIFLGIK